MLFTIVVVCKNEEKNIGRTIDSILKQQYKDFECLIVDGESDDNTLNIVKEYMEKDARIRCHSEKDNGIYEAMNRGASMAKGEYILFLNVKDVFADERVLADVAQVLNEKKPDMLGGSMLVERMTHNFVKKAIQNESLEEQLKRGMTISHQAIFAKKECFDKGFDLRYKIAADYDWLCKQVIRGKNIYIYDRLIAVCDAYGVSAMAKNSKLVMAEDTLMRKENFGMTKSPQEERKDLEVRKKAKIAQLMNDWLCLKCKKQEMESYFEKHNLKTIAIYGMHDLGMRLVDELEDTKIHIKYGIDRKCMFVNVPIPVITPDESMEPVDAIVVTAIVDYRTIKEMLEQKVDCTIISLEEIIHEMCEDIMTGEKNNLEVLYCWKEELGCQ
ncbi:MAG: glycosyltransferase [Lachnospiraceae bacterium]|nr:glycosyltransferase [Lachnospiraceae bacterium]